MHFDAAEHRDGIVFLHAVEDGPANRSYGLSVAKLAGVPAETIRQGEDLSCAPRPVLGAQRPPGRFVHRTCDVRNATECERLAAPRPSSSACAALDPDAMSPRDALDALYALKKLLDMTSLGRRQ